MCMRNVAPSTILALILAFCPFLAGAANTEPAVLLEYRPKQNVSYLVELHLTQADRHKDTAPETLHERAVINYGKTQAVEQTKSGPKPTMEILTRETNMKRPQYWGLKTLPPLSKKCPSGGLTKFVEGDNSSGHPWDVDWVWRTLDLLPVFSKTPVTPGDEWQTEMEMSFPGSPKYISPVRAEYRFRGMETVEKTRCAVIEYSFSGVFETAKHVEILETEFAEQRLPRYTLSGEGTVYFDTEAGNILRKEQHSQLTIKRTRKADADFARRHPRWAEPAETVLTCRLSARQISNEKASRLIEEAKKAEGNGAAGPGGQAVPKWSYFVTRTTVRRDKLQNEEETAVDRAFVGYGAGKPQIIYVDEQKQPLRSRNPHPPRFNPFPRDALSIMQQLPEPRGMDCWPVSFVANSFDMLPLVLPENVEPGATWQQTVDMCFYSHPLLSFAASVEHEVVGYEQKRARKCLAIRYSFTGEFRSDNHPERFTEDERREGRSEYRLKGNGLAYFDPAEGIIVEKEQTVSWTSLVERLRRLENGEVGWVSETDKAESVLITVSLHDESISFEPRRAAVKEGLTWRYLVERQHRYRYNEEEPSLRVDRAVVHYGAGAEDAGGQTWPDVVFLDEEQKLLPVAEVLDPPRIDPWRFPKYEKLTLVEHLPRGKGRSKREPIEVEQLSRLLCVPPLKPDGGLEEGQTWTSTLYLAFVDGRRWFPATIHHKLAGYETQKGRKCAVIEYELSEELKTDDHPERFRGVEFWNDHRAEYRLEGHGVIYFDLEEDILVEKDQTLTWTESMREAKEEPSGGRSWVETERIEQTVKMSVSLQE